MVAYFEDAETDMPPRGRVSDGNTKTKTRAIDAARHDMSSCRWAETSAANRRYHDTEWGVPLHDDRGQFEFLTLEVMQCGLNWELMIRKREIFRNCFDGFDFDRIAGYTADDLRRIMETPGMIRSERKIRAVIGNARAFRLIRSAEGSFSAWLWRECGGRTILYDRHAAGFLPAENALSRRIADLLKRRNFSYLGPVTVYSHLQACGIINDHGGTCPRYREINECFPTVRRRRDHEKSVNFIG